MIENCGSHVIKSVSLSLLTSTMQDSADLEWCVAWTAFWGMLQEIERSNLSWSNETAISKKRLSEVQKRHLNSLPSKHGISQHSTLHESPRGEVHQICTFCYNLARQTSKHGEFECKGKAKKFEKTGWFGPPRKISVTVVESITPESSEACLLMAKKTGHF